MASLSSGGRSASSASDWPQLHARELVIGVGAGAVIGGGIFTYRRISAGNEQRAEQALFAAQEAVQSGNPQQAAQALEGVARAHEGTSAATQATLLLAQQYYSEGKHAEGIAALQRIAGSTDEEFQASVQALIAAGHEGAGKYAEAAPAYPPAPAEARFPEDRESYRTDLARVLALSGDTAGAIEVWQAIAADPTSPHAAEARVRLGELEAKPASRG